MKTNIWNSNPTCRPTKLKNPSNALLTNRATMVAKDYDEINSSNTAHRASTETPVQRGLRRPQEMGDSNWLQQSFQTSLRLSSHPIGD